MSIEQDNKIRDLQERVAELERLVRELAESGKRTLSLKKDKPSG